jgi:cysteine desulfurase
MGSAPPLYWDWNATTPPHSDVVEAMRGAYSETWGNPSSPHQAGRAARARIEEVREQIGSLLELSPRDVIFVASGTEANNLALASAHALVVSRIDHSSIVRVAEAAEARGRAVHWLPVPNTGRLAVASVAGALEDLPAELREGAVVVLTAANHETGVIQEVAEIAAVVRAAGARLHVDAAQAIGKLPPSSWLGAHSYTIAAHKLRGPQGIAALAWHGPPPVPVVLGGSQERGLRPGTLSAPLVVGFGAALRRVEPRRYELLAPLRDELERQLAPYAVSNGAGVPRLPHVSNLSFAGWSGERLVAALDVRGLCVSTGSACRVGTTEPSAAVQAMGGAERARSALRISLGEDTSQAELERGIQLFFSVLAIQNESARGAF